MVPLFTVVILVFNQLDVTKQCIEHLKGHSTGQPHLLIVDNGSNEETASYLQEVADTYIRNDQNTGVIDAMNQAWPLVSTPYVMYLHNDVLLVERGWDEKVTHLLSILPNIGVAGFGGADGVEASGFRYNFTSGMVNAEAHGRRITEEYIPSVVVDGFCLIIKRSLLEELGGIGVGYRIHHFYDLDICLDAIYHGYRVATFNCGVNHLGGVTSVRPDYFYYLQDLSTTDLAIHQGNSAIFASKWGNRTPVRVEGDFRYTDAHGPVKADRGVPPGTMAE